MTRLITPILLLVFAALTGCGESSRVTSSGSTVSAVTLVSIAVGPPDSTVALGITTQFSATGVYSDGSKSSLSGVTWSSSAPTIATISNAIGTAGIATPVAAGTTTITATLGSIQGSTTLTVSPATLVSIAVTPAASSVPQGTNPQFTATGTYSDETTKNITGSVTWSSSLVGVATISNAAGTQGLATAVGAGSTTITATLNSISGSTTLAVTADTLLSIAVTPATPSIANGTSQQFVATGTYTNGTTQSTQNITTLVTWTSSNSAVAAINAAGLAKSATVGSVTITATLGTISGTALLTVTPATLVSVTVTPANPSIAKGTHEQFVATGTYTDGTTQVLTTTAVWVSSMPAVASVSNAAGFDGYAVGLTVGTTLISATVNGIAGSTMLTVTPATLVTISVTPANSNVAVGFYAQFTATGIYTDSTTQDLTTSVTWTSSTGAVTISSAAPNQGRASAFNTGATTITATLNGVSGSTTLHVTSASLTKITVTPAAPSIVMGSTESFTAIGTFSDNTQQTLTTSVMWTSGTTTVATISNAAPTSGVATAMAAGTTTITATIGGINGTTTLTVTAGTLTSITIVPPNPSIALGSEEQFTATGNYSNGTTQPLTTAVTWNSSAAGATISNAAGSNGLATGVSQGTVTITATLGAVTGSTMLTVTSAALSSIAVTPANAVISVGLTQQYVATGTYTDGTQQVLTDGAAWSSSVGSVAAISSAAATAGLATAIAAGTTQIVATVGTIASPGVTLTVKPATYAYVTNASGASISQYIVGLNGVLMPQSTPTIGNFTYPFAIVVDQTNTHAYMADYGKMGNMVGPGRIFQFLIGADGGLIPIPNAPAYLATGTDSGPNSVTLDPAGKNLYVAEDNNGYVDQFTINPDGTLTQAQHLYVDGSPVTVTFRPDGKYAYVTNSATGTDPLTNKISQFSVDPTSGALTPLTPATATSGLQPEGMAFDPTGSFAFAADTGSEFVSEFSVGGTTGLLAANADASSVMVGSQPITVTFDLTGTYVYVAAQNGGTLYQFKLQADGTLAALAPAYLATPNGTRDVTIDPTNHYAYVTVRSNPGVVLIYSISADGTLVPASNPSVAAGNAPTALATTH